MASSEKSDDSWASPALIILARTTPLSLSGVIQKAEPLPGIIPIVELKRVRRRIE